MQFLFSDSPDEDSEADGDTHEVRAQYQASIKPQLSVF